MKLAVNNIRASLDADIEEIKHLVSKKIKISVKNFKSFKIAKESIDARRKPDISIVYSLIVEVDDTAKIPSLNDVRIIEDIPRKDIIPGEKPLKTKPVIIGTGPAGLFAGLVLAEKGYKPILLERGECVENRTKIVNEYWKNGNLNEETNVQFGEGGAGTFSDGKLTTRINDSRCEKVLNEFFVSGAPEEILYKARPHIGTDILKKVVVNIRKRIESYGGEVRFNSKVTSFGLEKGKIKNVIINDSYAIETDIVILAIGHSARDTFEVLYNKGIKFIQKPFSIGVRIEHPQQVINQAQYGALAGHPKLGAADYQIFYKNGERTVYSFCMCPGGVVVASASEKGTIVTNGMSEFARDKENANSALVVTVGPEDFASSHPLAGVEFQRTWERKAFVIAGESNAAPIQTLRDFIEGTVSQKIGRVKPSYTGETRLSDINLCLPDTVASAMKESIGSFDRKLAGFGMADALLTGVETRTSSPVRIPRDESLQADGIKGIYPAGEGAGYAGGIVSAAVDGIRIAERIISEYYPYY